MPITQLMFWANTSHLIQLSLFFCLSKRKVTKRKGPHEHCAARCWKYPLIVTILHDLALRRAVRGHPPAVHFEIVSALGS